MSISNKIDEIKNSFNSDCKLFNNSKTSIEDIKNKYLGRRGLINSLYSLFNSLSKDEKSKYGLSIGKNMKAERPNGSERTPYFNLKVIQEE